MGRQPMSLDLDGITLEFYLVPAGGTETDAQLRSALFFPTREQGDDFDVLVSAIRLMLGDAFRYGVAEVQGERLDPYDLTQPQVIVWLFQIAVLTRQPVPIRMCVCNPQEAALHGGAEGHVFRLYATEGDTPAQWRLYRERDGGGCWLLDLLETYAERAKVPARRRGKSSAKPRFTAREQARLVALRDEVLKPFDGEYIPEVWAEDGADS